MTLINKGFAEKHGYTYGKMEDKETLYFKRFNDIDVIWLVCYFDGKMKLKKNFGSFISCDTVKFSINSEELFESLEYSLVG
jgi:hypothetical protein